MSPRGGRISTDEWSDCIVQLLREGKRVVFSAEVFQKEKVVPGMFKRVSKTDAETFN